MPARQRANRGSSNVGLVFLGLFGLPFLGFGGFMGSRLVVMLAEWRAAAGWIQTDATIQTLELERHTDSEGGTTERVVCTYAYRLEHRDFAGNRVGLSDESDNLSGWHADTYARLKQRFDRGEPVACYVDPDDPTTAILDRELRGALVGFHLVFVLAFGAVGLGLIGGALWASRRGRKRRTLATQHPDKPWMQNPEWAAGTIRPSTGRTAVVLWLAAVFWNAVSAMVPAFVIPKAVEEGTYWPLVLLVFPLIGLVLLWAAIRTTLVHRRFGRSRLELRTVPGVIGGRLRGDLVVVGNLASAPTVQVTLQCKRSVTEGTGDNRRTTTEVLWSESTSVDTTMLIAGNRVAIPVDFQIPYRCPPSDADDIKWSLEARADIPGVDLDLDFGVPVFKTSDSDPAVGPSEKRVAEKREFIESDESPLPKRIRAETDRAGNPCWVISANPGGSWVPFMLLFGVVFTGVAVFALTQLLNKQWFFACFLLAFGFFALVIWGLLISFIGSFRVAFARDELRVTRRFLGREKTRTVPLSEIDGVRHKESASSGGTKYYSVKVRAKDGRSITLANMIKGKRAAQWLVRRIEKRLPAKRPGG